MEQTDFEALYARAARRLVGQVYAVTGNLAEAEDVVQDAFAQAWVHRAELDTARSPEAWVRTVAMRRAVSRWRRQRNALVAWSRRQDRDSYETHDPFDPALVKALAELPPAQRLVLVLHHVADLPVATIAAELGAPEGTVKARLSRGRSALSARLGLLVSKEEHV